ncbi:myelin protein zero-like protein 2b [Chanos chanos]|uniref:Myelin protein zero-like protein 2b n=1 Tax=Chanos chanos TaxID=29144 RepID=A0A6J2W2W3_CHACN|nr:myelin protein zero-like protein 2 [Chanos chanos]
MFALMCHRWIYLFAVLVGLAPGLLHVTAMEVIVTKELEAVNGTDVQLKCTFKSTKPISEMLSVSWSFRPLGKNVEESLFFYQETGYPPTEGRFKEHVIWSGDVSSQDASITLQNVQFNYNGTYLCQVKNPPDVHGPVGEIHLKVVESVTYSEIHLLLIIVASAIGAVLLIVLVVVGVRAWRKQNRETDIEFEERQWKDPTVCKPEEAIHLQAPKKVLEVDSSDEEISEASSNEEEDNDEEDDDDDDDDDDDGGDDDD